MLTSPSVLSRSVRRIAASARACRSALSASSCLSTLIASAAASAAATRCCLLSSLILSSSAFAFRALSSTSGRLEGYTRTPEPESAYCLTTVNSTSRLRSSSQAYLSCCVNSPPAVAISGEGTCKSSNLTDCIEHAAQNHDESSFSSNSGAIGGSWHN